MPRISPARTSREMSLRPLAGQVLGPQQHVLPPGGFAVRPVVIALHLPADHAGLDGVVIIVLSGEMGDDPSVPQHGQRIADLLDLVQVMGDEDDGLALRLQAVHQPVQQLAALLGEGRGGLVHHQDLRLLHHHLGDLHQLALLQVQHGGGHPGLDVVGVDHVQGLPGLPLHGAAADQPQLVTEASAFA